MPDRRTEKTTAVRQVAQQSAALNAEIKPRMNVVGIFPNEPLITRLAGALLLGQNDKWQL